MTYETFERKIKDLGMFGTGRVRDEDAYWSRQAPPPRPPVLEVTWTTGGMSGGSCYGNDNDKYHAVEGEPEPEFEELDKVLEEVAAGITYLQYKRLVREAVTVGSYTEREFYGNSTTYAYKRVELRKLYDALVGLALI